MTTIELTLKENLARLLRIELGHAGAVTLTSGQLMVILTRASWDLNYGNIVQQIHRVIDECYPERSENVFILLRDEPGLFQNKMKIWKSV